MAASDANLKDIRNMMKVQTIGHDKVNQLRHVRFFGDIHGMVEHMRKHADIIRPKFEAVEEILERELTGLEVGQWTKPKGDTLFPLTPWRDVPRTLWPAARRLAWS